MSETNEIRNEETAAIPYYVHEGEMSRMERINKRWFISFLVVLVMLFLTNAGWIIYESQFETISYEQEAHSETQSAIALLNTGEGSINYGRGETTDTGAGTQSGAERQPAETLPDM